MGGLALDLDLVELLGAVGLGLGGGVGDLLRGLLELGVLGHEVGLGVDLDHGVAGDGDQTLEGIALGALAHVLRALDAQDLDGLLEVARGLVERLLAVEHPGAGLLAQLLDIRSGVVRHWRAILLVREKGFTGWPC